MLVIARKFPDTSVNNGRKCHSSGPPHTPHIFMCYTFPTSHPLDWLVVYGMVWWHVLHAYDIPPVDKIVGRASAHSPRPAGELVVVSPVIGGARVARVRLVFRVPVVRTTGVLRAAAAPRRRVCCLSLFSRVLSCGKRFKEAKGCVLTGRGEGSREGC